MTWYDKLTNHKNLMINIMSPITTSNRTITRKSVNMVAELENGTVLWTVRGIGQRFEGKVTKVLHVIALKTPIRFGADAVVDWMQWSGVPILAGGPAADRMPGRLIGESLDRLENPTFRLGLQSQEQSQEQHIQLHEDQLTTDTTDLKMTEDALAEETAAFKDTTQDCLAIQARFVEFKAYNKSLSEGLEALAKAKVWVIYEKTGDAEYQDNRSVLSSRGGLAGEPKSEHSIELLQLASHVVFAMHAETSNDDDPFAKVKGLISDMIARLEEKASADATHNATSNVYTVVHRTDGLKTIAKRVQGVSQLSSFFDETYYPEDSETEMMRYMTMLQHKDLSLTISMISLGPGVMKLNLVVYLASYSWPEVINIMLICDTKTKSRQSQGVPLNKFISAQHRNQTEDVKENKLKGLTIVVIEMFAVKSCKSPVYST